MKLSKRELLDILDEQEEKFAHLVWYARSDPNCYADGSVPDDIRAGAFVEQTAAEAKYPEETATLADPEIGDWAHGFNSGMLACLRFISSVLVDGLEIATEEFPDLDT